MKTCSPSRPEDRTRGSPDRRPARFEMLSRPSVWRSVPRLRSCSFHFPLFVDEIVRVEPIDDVLVFLVDHFALHFQRRSDLVRFDREIARQEREAADLFLPVEVAIEAVDLVLIDGFHPLV